MSLHDELKVESPCVLCRFLETLAPSERDEWELELRMPVSKVGNSAVVKALGRRGTAITEVSVRRHRSRHAVS